MRPGLHANRRPDSTKSGLQIPTIDARHTPWDIPMVRNHSQLNQTLPAVKQPAISAGSTSSKAQIAFDDLKAISVNGEVTYQMMARDVENDPIQIPVEAQATSEVANEKRKRNTNACRLFRQRRKEEQRRNSQSIAQLEQQIRQLKEEKEYFRKERDYFRETAFRNSG